MRNRSAPSGVSIRRRIVTRLAPGSLTMSRSTSSACTSFIFHSPFCSTGQRSAPAKGKRNPQAHSPTCRIVGRCGRVITRRNPSIPRATAGVASNHAAVGCRVNAAPVVVVGAGPAGLAVAATLTSRGGNVLMLERSDGVGANWRTRYDGLRLNTVRWLSHLPGSRIPARMGRWLGRDDYVDYLEHYAKVNQLRVQTGVTVRRIEPGSGAGWQVQTDAGGIDASAVIVATGAFDTPVMPRWPGLS